MANFREWNLDDINDINGLVTRAWRAAKSWIAPKKTVPRNILLILSSLSTHTLLFYVAPEKNVNVEKQAILYQYISDNVYTRLAREYAH